MLFWNFVANVFFILAISYAKLLTLDQFIILESLSFIWMSGWRRGTFVFEIYDDAIALRLLVFQI